MEGTKMINITLPSGATVELKERSQFKQKDRAFIYKFIKNNDSLDVSLGDVSEILTAVIACQVSSWSLDLLPPSLKIESLGELSIEDYDALAAEAEKVLDVFFPNLVQTREAEADPKVDTENSSD